MTTRLVGILALAAGVVPLAGAQQREAALERVDPPWVREVASKRILYSVPGMERVPVRKDLTYKVAAGRELKMDVYTPEGLAAGETRPVVVFVHGGYLAPNLRTEPKDWACYVSWGQLIAASGFAGVTFNHRLYSGWKSLEDSRSDLLDLLAFIRREGKPLGLDGERISLWAFSGAGPLLAVPLGDPQPYIRCLVSYYAFLDLEAARARAPDSVPADLASAFSPLARLREGTKGLPPIFVARAGLDYPGQNEIVDRFVGEALAHNLTIDVSNHPNGHHGFDIEDPGPRTVEIIRQTVEFIRANN